MPELPEVEATARNLREWLGGERLTLVELPASRILRGAKPATLERLLKGRHVDSIERRGKWLRLHLDSGAALYSHLGMTGKWVLRDRKAPAQPFERARLDTAKRSSLASVRYLDPRMFGQLVGAPDGEAPKAWRELGTDPLVDGLDGPTLAAALARTRRSIKEALLDQKLLAGVGNIQASESLWRARIAPDTPAQALAHDPKRAQALARAILDSIEYTLAKEQAPEISYVEESGAPNPFRVYGREGEPCPRCKTPLARVAQGGRSTYYCPRCQRG